MADKPTAVDTIDRIHSFTRFSLFQTIDKLIPFDTFDTSTFLEISAFA